MDRESVTVELVAELIACQFPQWAGLEVRPVAQSGWDNVTMRLGEDLSVRLPSGPDYVSQVDKEQQWLPQLAANLPVAISQPVARGEACELFPRPWSVYRWLPGAPPTSGEADLDTLALDVAAFLCALQQADPTGGPAAGWQSFYRGACPGNWDESARAAFAAIDDVVDVRQASAVWQAALEATWCGEPVWFHGDMSANNMLVADGKLSAVIDFGTCGVGDPACDLLPAWTMFSGSSRRRFCGSVVADEAMWARARGWALWKAATSLKSARERGETNLDNVGSQFGWFMGAPQVIEEVLQEA